MQNIGGASIFFPYCIEDEPLSSIPFLCSGAAKIWYVINAASKALWQRVSWTKSFSLTTIAALGRLLPRKPSFNPSIQFKDDTKIEVRGIVQKKRRFLVLASGVHRGGCNSGYNIAKATNVADFSWREVEKIVARNGELEKPLVQFTIPVEMISRRAASPIASSETRLS